MKEPARLLRSRATLPETAIAGRFYPIASRGNDVIVVIVENGTVSALPGTTQRDIGGSQPS
jgi:hypothetical protein